MLRQLYRGLGGACSKVNGHKGRKSGVPIMSMFLNAAEPVVVLVGRLLPPEKCATPGMAQILVSDDLVMNLPSQLAEFATFLAAPTLYSAVVAWVVEHGGAEDDLQLLRESNLIRVVRPGNTMATVDDFSGLRLVPLGYPVKPRFPNSKLVNVGATPDAASLMPISSLLAQAMWKQCVADDFPATIRWLAKGEGPQVATAALEAMEAMDGLLANRLAWLAVVPV